MPFTLDLHVHSRVSPDALDAPELLVDAARRAGLDGIAITDHDRGGAYHRLVRAGLADPSGRPVDGFLVIPGVEVSSLQGHILVLGATFDARVGVAASEVCRLARRLGALSIAAHPFDVTRSGVGGPALDRLPVDAIEGWNSKTVDRRSNAAARDYAAQRGLPVVAGSDAHFAATVGRACTRVDAPELTVEGVLSGIRAGRTELVEGLHTAREIAKYWAQGWFTRPWLFDLAKRTAVNARRRRLDDAMAVAV